MIDAAPGLNLAGLLLLFVCFELNRPLTNGEYLLILHILVFVDGVNDCFDKILNFSFGTLAEAFVLVVN